jgi:hypothetical protein
VDDAADLMNRIGRGQGFGWGNVTKGETCITFVIMQLFSHIVFDFDL